MHPNNGTRRRRRTRGQWGGAAARGARCWLPGRKARVERQDEHRLFDARRPACHRLTEWRQAHGHRDGDRDGLAPVDAVEHRLVQALDGDGAGRPFIVVGMGSAGPVGPRLAYAPPIAWRPGFSAGDRIAHARQALDCEDAAVAVWGGRRSAWAGRWRAARAKTGGRRAGHARRAGLPVYASMERRPKAS